MKSPEKTFKALPGGLHILADFYGVDAALLATPNLLRANLIAAADVLGVTIVAQHFHHFGEQSGVTGVLLLAESHISIHTWPECNFVAVDIFTCGEQPPGAAIDYLGACWQPTRVEIEQVQRGVVRVAARHV